MIEIRAQAIMAYFFTLALACILAFYAGYGLRGMQARHLITVQEVTERQDGILEDVEELRWRADSLEVHDGVNGAEIKSLKGKYLEIHTDRNANERRK